MNYHFRGKNGLYHEIVQSAIRTMHGTTQEIQKAGEGRPAEEQLRIFVRIFLTRVWSRSRITSRRSHWRELTR